jgi:hypothetical protein
MQSELGQRSGFVLADFHFAYPTNVWSTGEFELFGNIEVNLFNPKSFCYC